MIGFEKRFDYIEKLLKELIEHTKKYPINGYKLFMMAERNTIKEYSKQLRDYLKPIVKVMNKRDNRDCCWIELTNVLIKLEQIEKDLLSSKEKEVKK